MCPDNKYDKTHATEANFDIDIRQVIHVLSIAEDEHDTYMKVIWFDR